jgi:hypothetical protein
MRLSSGASGETMATTSKTIYTHTCDLCGEVRDEDKLAHLYGPADRAPFQGHRVDICADCQGKPISDALAAMAAAMKQQGLRTARIRSAG